MIRNLKVLLAAALALTALGAIAASAHAADEFRCSVNPCRGKVNKDATGAQAHHVFIVENAAKTESVSFTCEQLAGTGELVSGTDFSLSWSRPTEEREAYKTCSMNGSPGVVVHMNDCKYTFTARASGNAAAGTSDQAEVHIECPVGESIEITAPPSSKCVFTIGTQTLGGSAANGGIGYVTVGNEVTVTANVKGIVVTEAVIADCASIINGNQTLIGTYTTGNALLTAETSAGVMAAASFG
jgi:hypothetical protein